MKYLLFLVTVVLLSVFAGSTFPQPAPGAKPAAKTPAGPTATPTPASTRNAPANARPTGALAIVNGQTIRVTDLDPGVAQELGKLSSTIAQTRLEILDLQINTVLLENEAKKRKLTTEQLYDLEIAKRVTDPTEVEIKQAIEANSSQLVGADPQSARTQIIGFLRNERESKLSDDLVKRLRTTNPIVPGVDINAGNVTASAVLATVGGVPITAASISERLKPITYKLVLNAYTLAQAALNQTIDDMLLIAEANKRNIAPEEMVRTEITEKLHNPTPAEIAKFYNDNKARIPGELASVSNQIAGFLQQQDRARWEQALSERLRKSAQIQMFLAEPDQPVQTVRIDGKPSRGAANARVTIVEFTDFECPSCAAMNPVLDEVLKTYADRVRLVVRNFPLAKHEHAQKAAEAAGAANAQGKFFEYTALLFKRQNALDVASLKKYATELGLVRPRFDTELDSGKYADEVKQDVDDGLIYGIESTPTIFVNGVMLRELSPEALRAAIDRALGGTTTPAPK
jgi:protein-disulfide isomerase